MCKNSNIQWGLDNEKYCITTVVCVGYVYIVVSFLTTCQAT